MSNNNDNVKNVTDKNTTKLNNRTLGLKRWLSFIVTLSMIMSLIILPEIETYAYSGGTGTSSNPYLISSVEDINSLRTAVNAGNTYSGKYFKLTKDLALTDWNTAIATGFNKYFSGTFDGDYYEIDIQDNCSLFESINSATIKNLGITGTIKEGANNQEAAGFAIWATDSSFVDCYNAATIGDSGYSSFTGSKHAGIVTYLSGNCTFTNCYNTGNIYGKYAGGITLGYDSSTVDSGTKTAFTNCYNLGYISKDYSSSCPGSIVADEYVSSSGEYSSRYNLVNCYTDFIQSGDYSQVTVTDDYTTSAFADKLGSAYKCNKGGFFYSGPIHSGKRASDINVTWYDTSKTYNGSPQAAYVNAKISDNKISNGNSAKLESSDYTITYNGSTAAPSGVGTYQAKITLTDEGKKYFNIASGASTTMTISAASPSAPTDVKAEVQNDGTVKVSWTNSTFDGDGKGGLTYRVYYGEGPANMPNSVSISNGDTINGNFTVGKAYYFAVRAVNASGSYSGFSDTAGIMFYYTLAYENKTLESGVCNTPYNQSVAHALNGYGTTTYALASGSTLPSGLTLSSNGTISGTPTIAGTFTFNVTATNSGGSKDATMTLTINAVNPNAPTNVKAERQSNGSVKVSWTNSTSDGDGKGGLTYKVYYTSIAGGAGGASDDAGTVNEASSGVIISGLTAGRKYYFYVTATNKSGISSTSGPEVEASAIPYTDLAYSGKTLTAGTYGVDYSQSVADLTGGYGTTTYALKSGSSLPSGLTLASNGIISGTPTEAVTNKTFVITATNSAGSKDATMTLTINAVNPNAPTNVKAEVQNDGTVKVSWTNSTSDGDGKGGLTYKVFYGTSSSNLSSSKTLSSGGTIDGLTAGTTYYFKVRATNSSSKYTDSSVVNTIPFTDVAYSNKTLDSAIYGKSYSQSVAHATGGYGPATYALASGSSLPPGLSLMADGTLSGTPTLAGTYNFGVTVTKAGQTKNATMTLLVMETRPSAPRNVKAERLSDGSIKLTWDPPESDGSGKGIQGYNVKVSYLNYGGYLPSKGYYQKCEAIIGESEISIRYGATIYFEVYAVGFYKNMYGSYDLSAASEKVSIIPYKDIAYTNKTLPAGTASQNYNQVVTHVTGGYGTTTYTLVPGSSLPPGLSLASNGTLSGTPTKSGTYNFDVMAANSGSGQSATATMTVTINGSKPGVPTIEATSGENGKATITWTAPSNTGGVAITGYIIQRSDDGKNFQTVAQPSSIDTRYVDSGLTNGKTYSYRMVAVNSIGNSDFSSVVTAKPYKVPETVENLAAKALSKNSIGLSWGDGDNGGDDITAYVVKVYSDAEYKNEITSSVNVGTVTDKTVTVDGLTKDTTYYFTVSAINRAGTGEAAKVSGTTFTNPEAPTDLSAEVVSSTEIKLTWAAPENDGGEAVTSYNIYYREKAAEGETANEWTKAGNTAELTYVVGELTPGTLYEFKVTAMNGETDEDESPDGAVIEIIPAKEPIAPVIGELISRNASIDITSVEVSDNFGDAVNKYSIYVSRKNEDGSFGEYTKLSEVDAETDSSSNILASGLEICVKKVSKKDALFFT